jgi:DNA-binding GntR family transcriptional regulator
VADRALLGRTSRAEQVAAIPRTRIAAGFLRPGERLVQDEITALVAAYAEEPA